MVMKRNSVLFVAKLLIALFTHTLSLAQGLVSGTVIDGKGQPLLGASVLLLNPKDSALVQGAVTSKDGKYAFRKVSRSAHFISASYAGFKDAYSAVFSV